MTRVADFFRVWGRTLVLVALAVAVCAPVSYCSGVRYANKLHDAELALANKLAQDRAITVIDQAANERVADAITEARDERKLTDAIADTPDGAPDAVRVQLGCQRLRTQGTAEADLPASCRPDSGDAAQTSRAP